MPSHTHRASLFVALLSVACVAAGPEPDWIPASADTTTEADPASGYAERPIGVQALSASAPAPDDSILLFKDKNFDDRVTNVGNVTAGAEPWKFHSFGTSAKHFSSIRWNLPRGVIVTVFEEDDGRGRTINLCGSGEIAELKAWKLDNQLSGWSWNYVGGVEAPSKNVKDALAERPRFAREVAGTAMDSLIPCRDRDGKDAMPAIEHVTDKPANVYHEMPKGVSSLRWTLPEGVVVTFAGTKEGVGQQMATWGSGQFDTFAHWKMNDKMKFWAWHWVGEKQ